MKTRRSSAGWAIACVLIVLYALFPVLWILSLSFKTGDDINNGKFLPSNWSWDNYDTVFDTSLFTSALRNSIGVSVISTVVSVFLAKRLILSLALAIAMFPTVALISPLFDMWRSLGLYDTWLGLILPYLSFTLPLSIWVLSAFFREIPWEMEQAAQVDGATAWQAFRKVIVPLAAPGVFTAAIITFFFAWNDFAFGISLTASERARTVPAALAFFVGPDQFNPPVSTLSAAAVIVTIPIVAIVLLFQRRIVA